jgi:hypothetical protein
MMKKWLIGCGLALVIAAIAAAGLGYLGFVKVGNWNSSRKARITAQQAVIGTGIAQRRKYLESHLSQETCDSIPAEFYTYDGFRDWWRLPLVFPYQLMCIDTRDKAYLEKYDPKHRVSDPNKSSSGVFGDITRIATDNKVLVFERKSTTPASFGILQYESGIRTDFSEEMQMWDAAKQAGYSGRDALLNVDDLFSAYYDYEKAFVEQAPRGDVLKAAPQE